MIEKGVPIRFLRHYETSKRVYGAISNGYNTRRAIIEYTGLLPGQVRSSVNNLLRCGMIHSKRSKQRYSLYYIIGCEPVEVSSNLKGISFIFRTF